MTDAPAASLSQKRELHDDAKSLIEDKAFQHAISQLRVRWYEQMLAALDREQRDELMAMSKALRGIQDELVVIINDYKKAVHDAARRQSHG